MQWFSGREIAEWKMKMKSNKVTIDSELYEKISILVMSLGLDMSTNEFIIK